MTFPVTIPLLNPNETEAVLAALHIREGQRVSEGDPLATVETTKSAADITAERSGYIAGLCLEQGQTVQAGERLCYIAETPDWSPAPAALDEERGSAGGSEPPPGLRITQPALALARQLGVDLGSLPTNRLVTENVLRALRETPAPHLQSAQASIERPESEFDAAAVLIYGGGGHGKALIDLLRALRIYHITGVLDDSVEAGVQIMGIPVLGGAEALAGLHARGVRQAVNAVGGIGNIAIRVKVFQRLAEAGFTCPALVHPAAFVEPSAEIVPGAQVFAQSYVGSEAQVGFGAIVNTGAIVSHDCRLGDFANISPGAMLAGEVSIGAGALVGMGATVNLRVRVGPGARIGNGATVKEDVPEKGIVRAGAIWP